MVKFLVVFCVVFFTALTPLLADIFFNVPFPLGFAVSLIISCVFFFICSVFVEENWIEISLLIIAAISLFAALVVVYYWWQTSAAIRDKIENKEKYGANWAIDADHKKINVGIAISASRLIHDLVKNNYKEIKGKSENCSNSLKYETGVFCKNANKLYIKSHRSSIYPSLELTFTEQNKKVLFIKEIPNYKKVNQAKIEPQKLFVIKPDISDDGKLKQSPQVFYRIKLGNDISQNSLFIRLLEFSEDRRRLSHNGIDYRGIIRALKMYILEKNKQGGSTISSQVCKQLFNRSKRRTYLLKVKEFFCSAAIESYFRHKYGSKKKAKTKLLELYLNIVPLAFEKPNHKTGKNIIREEIIGVGTASKLHFGKDLADLNPAEMAAIIVALRSPKRIKNNIGTEKLRNRLLRDFIKVNPKDARQAKPFIGKKIKFKYYSDGDLKTDDALIKLIRRILAKKKVFSFQNANKAISVSTSIDFQMQQVFAPALENKLLVFRKTVRRTLGSRVGFEVQADLLIVSSQNGKVVNYLSLKTEKNKTIPNFQSLQDPFRPGSCLKTLFTTQMIERRIWTMGTMVNPSKCSAPDGAKHKEAEKFNKFYTVQNLLVFSNNPYTYCMCSEITITSGRELLGKLLGRSSEKIDKLEKKRQKDGDHPCRLFNGSGPDSQASIFELISPFTAYPSGVRKDITLFEAIHLDGISQTLPKSKKQRMFSEEAATVVASSLSDAARRKFSARYKGDLFVKTGSLSRDYVQIAGSRSHVFLIHFRIIPKNSKAFPDGLMQKIYSGNVITPLMNRVLTLVVENRSSWIQGNFSHPNVHRVRVQNGCRSIDGSGKLLPFIKGTEPEYCLEEEEEEKDEVSLEELSQAD